jgi:hypothetical protein
MVVATQPVELPVGASLSMADHGSPSTTHYEVVDDNNALVGNMKHSTIEQALEMRTAFADLSHDGAMHVAMVTETVVVERRVYRIDASPAKIMRGARKLAA